MTARHDAVIVGGGFAGLAAAEAAAARGLATLVLERKREAGSGIHTTGLLSSDALATLALPPSLLGRRLDAVDLVAPSGRGSRFERAGHGFTPTRTRDVLAALEHRALAAGAEIRHGAGVMGVLPHARGVAVVTEAGAVDADRVVAADGTRSAVAASLGVRRHDRVLRGVEVHADVGGAGGQGALERDACLLLVHREWAPGYAAWAFEGCDGLWQVGVLGHGRRYRPDVALAAFLEWLERKRGFRARRIVETRGGIVPTGGARGVASERVVLAGDAGGHVSAVSAGGIGRAVEAGAALGWRLAEGPAAWRPVLREQRARAGGHRLALATAHDAASLACDELVVRLAASGLAHRFVEDVLFRAWPALSAVSARIA